MDTARRQKRSADVQVDCALISTPEADLPRSASRSFIRWWTRPAGTPGEANVVGRARLTDLLLLAPDSPGRRAAEDRSDHGLRTGRPR